MELICLYFPPSFHLTGQKQQLLDGRALENNGKLILTEIFQSVQKHFKSINLTIHSCYVLVPFSSSSFHPLVNRLDTSRFSDLLASYSIYFCFAKLFFLLLSSHLLPAFVWFFMFLPLFRVHIVCFSMA